MKPLRRLIVLALCMPILPTVAPAIAQDRMVLGIEIGKRFMTPECGLGETAFPARSCFDRSVTSRTGWGADEYFVYLPSAGTPPYVRGEIRVSVMDGIVEAIQVGTWGIQAQGIALEALNRKYGAPTRSRQERQNALRSRFPVQFAEWELKDFSVKLDGTTGSIDWGRIEVSTHRYRRLVGDYRKQPAKSPQ